MHANDLAYQSQSMAHQNDFGGTFRIVRGLTGFNPVTLKTVFLKSGSLSNCEGQRQLRWQEHFTDLFQGSIVLDKSSLAYPPPIPVASEFCITYDMTAKSIDILAAGKGVGPDQIAGEIF